MLARRSTTRSGKAMPPIDVKLARQGIELDHTGFAIDRYMRMRNRLVANGIDDEIAARHHLGIKNDECKLAESHLY